MDFAHTPGLLIASDGTAPPEGAARSGARILAVLPIAAAAEAIAGRVYDAVLIDAEADSPALRALLASVSGDGATVVLSLAPPVLDLAWDLAPDARLLSRPSADELADALAGAFAPVEAQVAERRDHFSELHRLGAEAGRIAQALVELSVDRGDADTAPDGAHVRALIRARRLRDRFFDPALFADPAWDMMLDLYAAGLEDKQVAVSSLCIAAAVPTTTALRWIRSLTDAGIFARVADPNDGRRFFIALSEQSADGLAAYFAELRRQGLPSLS